MSDIFLQFDITSTIYRCFGSSYPFGFVALHPFYKKVFADKYDYYDKLQFTFPLIETVSWEVIAKDIGFKNKETLANALLLTQKPHFRELRDFLAYKDFEFPLYMEDTIPIEIIIPILQALHRDRINEVVRSFSQDTSFGDERIEVPFMLDGHNCFEIGKELLHCCLIKIPERRLAILLPMRDCPYTLVLAMDKVGLEFIEQTHLEGFFIDESTKFFWWE